MKTWRSNILRVVLRFFTILLNAVIFAVVSRMLSPKDAGIWSLASALTGIVLSLDLGITNYARNRLSEVSEGQAKIFLSCINLAGLVTTFHLVLLIIIACLAYLNVFPQILRGDVVLPLCGGALLLALRIPFNIAINAFYSYGEEDLYAWVEMFSVALSGLGTLLALLITRNLYFGIVSFFGISLVTNAVAMLFFFQRRGWEFDFTLVEPGEIIIKSYQFGILQITGILLTALPPFVIGYFVGVVDVTIARAAMMIAQAVLAMHLAHAMPIWSDVTRLFSGALAQSDLQRLKRRLKLESVAICVALLSLTPICPLVIKIWIGDSSTSSGSFFLIMIWACGCGIGNIYSLPLNGLGRPFSVTKSLIAGGMVGLFGSFFLYKSIGPSGVFVSYAIGAIVAACITTFEAIALIEDMSVRRCTFDR